MTAKKRFGLIFIICIPVLLMNGQSPNWMLVYDNPLNMDDEIYDMTSGATSDIYAAGTSRYDSTGYDFFVMSVSMGGDTNWTFVKSGAGGTNSSDHANAITCGADGSIYAAGRLSNGTSDYDFTVASLTPYGDTNWIYRKTGTNTTGYDEAMKVVYGLDNNIYAVGWLDNFSTSNEFTVVSLDTLGSERWIYQLNGNVNQSDLGMDIDFGIDGNIYAFGRVRNMPGPSNDWTVVSLDTAGNERWVWCDSTPQEEYCTYSIVYGWDDNIYVCGGANDSTVSGFDFTVRSLDTAGQVRWEYQYDHAGGADIACGMEFGPDGDLYAVGYVSGANNSAAVVRLDTAGNQRWLYLDDSTGSIDVQAWVNPAFDNSGSIYFGGSRYNGSNDDFFFSSIDSSGGHRWTWQMDHGGDDDYGQVVIRGPDDNIYCGAIGAAGASYQEDIVVLCFDAIPPTPPVLIYPPDDTVLGDTSAAFIWHRAGDAGTGVRDYILQYDDNGSFVAPVEVLLSDTVFNASLPDTTMYYWRVTAIDSMENASDWSETWNFYVHMTGIREATANAPSFIFTPENNPAMKRAVFAISLNHKAKVSLKIYDAAGRLVATPVSSILTAGRHAVNWPCATAGVYFYRLEAMSRRQTGKFVILE